MSREISERQSPSDSCDSHYADRITVRTKRTSMRNMIRDFLLRWGWDVRRSVSIENHRRAEWHRREIEKWKSIQCYRPRTVLDIGANTGQFAELAREILPKARIISFEPLRDCAAVLEAAKGRLAPLEVYPFALGDEDQSAEFHRNKFSPSSSLLEMRRQHIEELPETESVQSETIQVRRLDSLSAELNLEDPIFVKIDVQGYTEPVLLGGKSVICRSIAVVAEVSVRPLYEGEATFDRINQILAGWGFVYRGNIDQWISQRDGRILQCDCLFENSNLLPGH